MRTTSICNMNKIKRLSLYNRNIIRQILKNKKQKYSPMIFMKNYIKKKYSSQIFKQENNEHFSINNKKKREKRYKK